MVRSVVGLVLVCLVVVGCGGDDDDPAAECGNGVVEGFEQCDDGNVDYMDGCLNDCTAATCGDGVARADITDPSDPDYEACDDGEDNGSGDGLCAADCSGVQLCGDGVANGTETCDDGMHCDDGAAPQTACTQDSDCAGIGDGACLPRDGDYCGADCTTVGSCGDGTVQALAGEACDDGNADPDDDCPTGPTGNCQPNVCGDGFPNLHGPLGAEQCDAGALNGTDSDCSTGCTHNRCGDGVLNTVGPDFPFSGGVAEACDDGDGILADDCPDGPAGLCQSAICGDGFTNLLGPSYPDTGTAEECDDGNADDTDACSNACAIQPSCGVDQDGDGSFLDPGEACDFGAAANSDTLAGDCTTVCRTDCTCPGCGDGVTDYALGEQCDDHDTDDGDGCSATCQIEVGAACGNGLLEPANAESCDDGSQCTDGTDCTDNAPICTGIGDGSCAPRAGDGCSATCQYELVGQMCGDSSDPAWDVDVDAAEQCDDAKHCDDGSFPRTSCTADGDCTGIGDGLCLVRNGDDCSTTCSNTLIADTFHPTGDGGVTLTSDNQYLWWGNEYSGEVWRLDVAACAAHHAGTATPCVDASAGAPGCPDPCTAQRIAAPVSPTDPVNNTMHIGHVATDGHTLWYEAIGSVPCTSPTEVYLYALDIAACDAALGGGATSCDGLETLVVGGAPGVTDGVGGAAAIENLRGLTYHDGYLYSVHGSCGILRRIDPITQEVVTIVGDPACPGGQSFQEGFGGILPASGGASLLSPRYMATDYSGFLYISDNFDHTISRYNVNTNYLERFVGDPIAGYGHADSNDGTQARFARPRDLATDGTSLYVADFDNYTVRQVDIATGRVTTMVGVPSPGTPQSSKCDNLFGRGAAPAVGPRFAKPFTMTYHFPSQSLFFSTGGTRVGPGCFGGPACGPAEVLNQIWRVR